MDAQAPLIAAIAVCAVVACGPATREPSSYVGKVVLVGVTLSASDGSSTRQLEVHGTVQEVDPAVGIVVRMAGSREEFYLPPVFNSLREVNRCVYRERHTGVVVAHADYATVWAARMEAGVPSDSVDWTRGMTWQHPLEFTFPGDHWVREGDE